MIRASGWPTLTWSPTATSSSTTPSTGAVSACSIFIASTVTTTAPAVDRPPSATPTATTEPGMGLASSASPLCSSSGRTGASRTSSTTAVRPAPASQICPSDGRDEIVGAQPVERDDEPVAVEMRCERTGFAVLHRGRRARPACRSGTRGRCARRRAAGSVVRRAPPDPPARRHLPQAGRRGHGQLRSQL